MVNFVTKIVLRRNLSYLPYKIGEAGQNESSRQRPLPTLRVQLHVPLSREGDACGIGGVRVLHGLAHLLTRFANLK